MSAERNLEHAVEPDSLLRESVPARRFRRRGIRCRVENVRRVSKLCRRRAGSAIDVVSVIARRES